jgi:hypothetical protein
MDNKGKNGALVGKYGRIAGGEKYNFGGKGEHIAFGLKNRLPSTSVPDIISYVAT